VWVNDTATGGIANVVEDTTPQLGGTLDANGNTIDMGANVITDTKVGQWDTAYGWGDHASAGYLASSSYTAADVLTKVKTVDGSGSGLDADLLDGQQGSYYYSPANAPDPTLTLTGDVTGSATFTNLGNATLTAVVADDSHNHVISNVDGLQAALDGKAPLIGTGASGTWGINITGNAGTATNLSNTQSNWSSVGGLGNVVGMLAWKNYGNNHVIFDASQSTTPSGTSCNNTNSTYPWIGTYPTLMGWNGSDTYGVRVDSARDADLLDGAQPSVAASNDTIVQRHSSGYIFANYFNTTANDVTSAVTSVMVETGNDNYIRHGKPSAIASFLDGIVVSGATATRNGHVAYYYNPSNITPVRGDASFHVFHMWTSSPIITVTNSSFTTGDICSFHVMQPVDTVTVNATRIYLPNGSYDNSITFTGTGSFTLVKYTGTAGYWMVAP
jgi:hypothetical protein